MKLTVKLEEDNMEADVVAFDVKDMLASLFNSPELNHYNNLVVNSTDQFAKYVPDNGLIGEVNSSSWYGTAYNNCINNPNKDFLCPLILASDKTTLSEIGDLHVDAIFMSTSIFNIKVN